MLRTESSLQGSVEVDESYFGAQRIRGERSRGVYGKTIVFGVLKRQEKGSYGDCARLFQGDIASHYPWTCGARYCDSFGWMVRL